MKKRIIPLLTLLISLTSCVDIQQQTNKLSNREETVIVSKNKKEYNQEKNKGKEDSYHFFNIYDFFIHKDKEDNIIKDTEENKSIKIKPVKYTEDLFVENDSNIPLIGIFRISSTGDKELLYSFDNIHDFNPIGKIDDFIYGEIINNDKMNYLVKINPDTGQLYIIETTYNQNFDSYIVTDKALEYKTVNEDVNENPFYTHYSIPLEHLDWKANVVEVNANDDKLVSNLKVDDNQNKEYEIYTINKNYINLPSQTIQYNLADNSRISFINNSMIIYTDTSIVDEVSFYITIINLNSFDTLINEEVKGVRVVNNILYYVDTNNEIKSQKL
jgi:lipoprotein